MSGYIELTVASRTSNCWKDRTTGNLSRPNGVIVQSKRKSQTMVNLDGNLFLLKGKIRTIDWVDSPNGGNLVFLSRLFALVSNFETRLIKSDGRGAEQTSGCKIRGNKSISERFHVFHWGMGHCNRFFKHAAEFYSNDAEDRS